jgi:DNA-binding MarR family transcriptional regulator
MGTDELYLETRILTAIVAKTAMRALEQRLDLASAGLSHSQYGIMRALSCQEQTISELSHRFMLDPSTLVPAVDALERKGFAKRGRDPNDRRRVPLSLTEAGVRLVTDVPFVDDDDPLVQSLNAMSDEHRQQLLTLLRELVQHLPAGEDILRRVSSRVQVQVNIEEEYATHTSH